MEALVDACLPNHGQGRHVQRVAHGGPTAPDRPLASFVATVPRPRCEPHSEVKALLSRGPNSGRKATSMAAVREPTPGTLRYRAACGRRAALRCHRAWYSLSSRAIPWSSQAMCRRVDRPTAGLMPLSSRFRSWTRWSTSCRRLRSRCCNSSRSSSFSDG